MQRRFTLGHEVRFQVEAYNLSPHQRDLASVATASRGGKLKSIAPPESKPAIEVPSWPQTTQHHGLIKQLQALLFASELYLIQSYALDAIALPPEGNQCGHAASPEQETQ